MTGHSLFTHELQELLIHINNNNKKDDSVKDKWVSHSVTQSAVDMFPDSHGIEWQGDSVVISVAEAPLQSSFNFCPFLAQLERLSQLSLANRV